MFLLIGMGVVLFGCGFLLPENYVEQAGPLIPTACVQGTHTKGVHRRDLLSSLISLLLSLSFAVEQNVKRNRSLHNVCWLASAGLQNVLDCFSEI